MEHSFHTNTRAAGWLLQEENLRRLAQREARVVAEFLQQKSVQKEESYTLQLRTLYKGLKGEDVRAMQALLALRGFPCGEKGADGSFGPATDTALRTYQQSMGLAVDGRAGPATMKSLLGVGK